MVKIIYVFLKQEDPGHMAIWTCLAGSVFPQHTISRRNVFHFYVD